MRKTYICCNGYTDECSSMSHLISEYVVDDYGEDPFEALIPAVFLVYSHIVLHHNN